jgi:UDP-3-O-[3-hydroxymyristoyl] glucosamine N-acyltransferase
MPPIWNRQCVIADDARIGEGTRVGNFVLIRENTTIGRDCLIGSYVDIEGDVRVGDFVSLQSGCYLTRAVQAAEQTLTMVKRSRLLRLGRWLRRLRGMPLPY